MFVPTELLFDFAEKEGISWGHLCLPDRMPAYYFREYRFIGINNYMRPYTAEFREVFSEELGHAETLDYNPYSADPTYLGRILDDKIERFALIWAVNFLIPTDEYISLCVQLSDCSVEGMIYQLAEYFGVTPRFIKWKERIINEKGIGWDSFGYALRGYEGWR